MKQYQLLQDYRGIPKDTVLYGPAQITGGGLGFFKKEDLPTTDEGGTNCIFASAIESNPTIFKNITPND